MDVRIYRDEDFDGVWPLFEQASRFYQGDDAPSADRIRRYVKDEVLADSSAVELALALDGDTPVGLAAFAVLHPGPGATGQLYLKELFVLEQHRGKGAGKALMKFLAGEALKRNCSRFDWSGETSNPDGLAFYRSLKIAPTREKVYFRLSGDALRQFAQN